MGRRVADGLSARGPLGKLARHWPEYAIEAAGLALFMVSAGLFTVLLEHPESPVRRTIADPLLRRTLVGLAMGATAIGIIYSRWGKRSGAHINPAVTLTFYRLGKIEPWDAAYYVGAQFLGAVLGVLAVSIALGVKFSESHVRFVVTVPGPGGSAEAFAGELVISFLLMLAILLLSNVRGLNRYTGLIAGLLVATYIALEAPLSGMSMNPARTFGSAAAGRIWTALWVYFTAPPLGMLLAAEIYVRLRGAHRVLCAKLHHDNNERCIFRCGFRNEARVETPSTLHAATPLTETALPRR